MRSRFMTMGDGKMLHALVIEDDPRLAGQLCDLAMACGTTSVDVAATEQDAFETAIQHRPSIILSDGKLAEGTGPAACFRIRQRLGDIPVIFITASPALCNTYPYASAVFSKPVPWTPLMNAVDRVMPR